MQAFAVGKEYARQRLLDFVGSRQAQSGVLWGPKEPGCVICTSGGRHGKKAGYSDELLPDGSWWYFRQGMNGDQQLTNSANSKLASRQLSVLLFTTREPTAKEVAAQGGYGKLFGYRGLFNVADHQPYIPAAGIRAGDHLIRFRLMPAEEGEEAQDDENILPQGLGPSGLQEWLRVATSQPVPIGLALVQYYQRCAQIRRYAKLRARGICEGCGTQAPFVSQDGTPFLEVHHLIRLADDGPDTPENVAALCPNCHRRVHHGSDRLEFNAGIVRSISAIEAGLR
jgi:5-methylcytosine-specific restriction protein A